MDTIKLRVTQSDKSEKLREKLHDQLLAHAFTQTKISRYRGMVIAGIFNGVKFSSKFVPQYLETAGWAELEFHTWRIKTYSQLLEWIFLLVGNDRSIFDFIISEMRISRLDFCLDIYAPHNFISSNMYKVGAVVWRQYRSKLETTYLGAGEDVFATYTKAELTIDDAELVIPQEINSKGLPYSMQRLEHRRKGRKLPIYHIVDFPDLINFLVFEKLKIWVLNEHGLNTIPEDKKASLLSLITDYGIHQSRKKLNTSRNFSRTYGVFFDDHANLIREAWKQKIYKYFR
jgi:hypothetical protein